MRLSRVGVVLDLGKYYGYNPFAYGYIPPHLVAYHAYPVRKSGAQSHGVQNPSL